MTDIRHPTTSDTHRRTNLKKNEDTRIGVVGLRGIPGVMGGVESHAEQLYPRLKRLAPRHAIHIAQRRSYVDRSRHDFAGLHLWPLLDLKSKYLEAIVHTFIAILFLRVRRGCRVLHVHAIGPGLLVPLARLLGMRVVLTHHGADYQRAKWNGTAKRVLRLSEWIALSSANQVIVVSQVLADALRARFSDRADRIHMIPNGASRVFSNASRTWAPAILDQFGLKQGEYILAVARLVPEKGLHDLIAAFKAAGGSRKLVIAGTSDHEDGYARSLLDQADDTIIFTGFQSHEVLRTLYAAADLFVLPSHHEGLPIAALEAAAMNAPMLLSDIPPNVELALPAHCYFPVGDVEALAAKLRLPRGSFAIDGDSVSARYDWDQIALQTNKVIEQLVEHG